MKKISTRVEYRLALAALSLIGLFSIPGLLLAEDLSGLPLEADVASAAAQSVSLGELVVRVNEVRRRRSSAAPPDQDSLYIALEHLLENRLLASQAVHLGLADRQDVRDEIHMAVDRILARRRMELLDEQTQQGLNLKLLAKEYYLANRDQFLLPEEVKVSHLLIKTDCRGSDAANKLLEELRAKLVLDSSLFESLVDEYSEDLASKPKHGDLGWVNRKQLEPNFSKAVFLLQEQGEISPIIETRFGLHLARLDGRKEERLGPFDEVKDRLMSEQKAAVFEARRREYVAAMRSKAPFSIDDDLLYRYLRELNPLLKLEQADRAKREEPAQ